jgi:hypothetical protein
LSWGGTSRKIRYQKNNNKKQPQKKDLKFKQANMVNKENIKAMEQEKSGGRSARRGITSPRLCCPHHLACGELTFSPVLRKRAENAEKRTLNGQREFGEISIERQTTATSSDKTTTSSAHCAGAQRQCVNELGLTVCVCVYVELRSAIFLPCSRIEGIVSLVLIFTTEWTTSPYA